MAGFLGQFHVPLRENPKKRSAKGERMQLSVEGNQSVQVPRIVVWAAGMAVLLLVAVLVQSWRARRLNSQGKQALRKRIARWARVAPVRISLLRLVKMRAVQASGHKYAVTWHSKGRIHRRTCIATLRKPSFGKWLVTRMTCRGRRPLR